MRVETGQAEGSTTTSRHNIPSQCTVPNTRPSNLNGSTSATYPELLHATVCYQLVIRSSGDTDTVTLANRLKRLSEDRARL
jgi:hypothetical protein